MLFAMIALGSAYFHASLSLLLSNAEMLPDAKISEIVWQIFVMSVGLLFFSKIMASDGWRRGALLFAQSRQASWPAKQAPELQLAMLPQNGNIAFYRPRLCRHINRVQVPG